MRPNTGGLSATSLSSPTGVFGDGNGIYVADSGNNRVLYYLGASTTALRVYGQSGSFVSASFSAPSADSLWGPQGLWADSQRLLVADFGTNRTLRFTGTSTTAFFAFGQANLSSTNPIQAPFLQFNPSGVAVYGSTVFIVDSANHRILSHSLPSSSAATEVWGQGGRFNSYSANYGGVSQNSLNYPKGVSVDSTGNVCCRP